MSDKPKKRSRVWIGWTALAVFLLYPLSAAPACLFGAWSVELGLFRSETVARGIDTVYAPVIWMTDKVPTLRNAAEAVSSSIEPLAPHGKWF
jgi:hypothetical protein